MNAELWVTLIVSFGFVLPGQTANIAMFTMIGSSSHTEIFYPIAEELIARGHNVTFFTSHKPRAIRPGLNEIFLEEFSAEFLKHMPAFFTKDGRNPDFLAYVGALVNRACPAIWIDPAIVALRNSKEVFDVSILDALFENCMLPFISSRSKSVIYLSTAAQDTMIHRMWYFGVPVPSAYVPNNHIMPYTCEMNFYERLVNTFSYLFVVFVLERNLINNADKFTQERMPELLSFKEAQSKIPLILTNGHPAIGFPAPTAPVIKQIGGVHIKNITKPLSADLEKFVSESGDAGFIFISFGSIVPVADMPTKAKNAFIEALSRIPQRVLWKSNVEIPDLSPNVKLIDWAPQQDLLAHPKIKAFVTHGGLFGLMETVYHGVPIVGLPVFADQPANINKAEFYGFGVALDWETLTSDLIEDAINKVINDPSFKENAVKRQKILRDNLVPPRQEAAYWVEYVLRHQGSLHLRLPVEHLNLLQYFLLDVIGFVLAVVGVVALVLYKLVRLLMRLVCGSKKNTQEKSKSRKKKE